jgi:hypothetical protein
MCAKYMPSTPVNDIRAGVITTLSIHATRPVAFSSVGERVPAGMLIVAATVRQQLQVQAKATKVGTHQDSRRAGQRTALGPDCQRLERSVGRVGRLRIGGGQPVGVRRVRRLRVGWQPGPRRGGLSGRQRRRRLFVRRPRPGVMGGSRGHNLPVRLPRARRTDGPLSMDLSTTARVYDVRGYGRACPRAHRRRSWVAIRTSWRRVSRSISS